MATDATSEAERRGPYVLSARLRTALTLLASGEVRTQKEAAAAAEISVRALQKAVRRESVQKWMQDQIMTSLGLSALKAAKRMDELLHSPNEMVGFRASSYALAVRAGVQPPDRSGPLVQIGIQ
jgi:hypothetical protein